MLHILALNVMSRRYVCMYERKSVRVFVATNSSIFRVISFHLFSPFLVIPIIVFLVRIKLSLACFLSTFVTLARQHPCKARIVLCVSFAGIV